MSFYLFSQNNSGGVFDESDTVAAYVIIEAKNASEANDIAETKGIYFNGCDNDMDCPCCGDRWSSVSEYDKTESPSIYDKTLAEHIAYELTGQSFSLRDGVVVYFQNGDRLNVNIRRKEHETQLGGVQLKSKLKRLEAVIKLNGKRINLKKLTELLPRVDKPSKGKK